MKALALTLLVASLAFGSTGLAQAPDPRLIEGRWTVDTGQCLPGAVPRDLVLSVDGDRVYGMLGDFQIHGTIKDGVFSFDVVAADKPTKLEGTLQAGGTLTGKVSVTSGRIPGNQLTKDAPWTAKRTVIGQK
jgi:hypothetical protein